MEHLPDVAAIGDRDELGADVLGGFTDEPVGVFVLPNVGAAVAAHVREQEGDVLAGHLLRDALYDTLPGTLREELFPGGIDLVAVLEATYRSAAPQAYLASFTGALAKHLDMTYVQDLIASRFFALTRVLSRSFSAQELQQVRASGSVASGFQGVLRDVLAERRMHLTAVVRDPLPGLVAYHAKATP